jgi:hypothetical protein
MKNQINSFKRITNVQNTFKFFKRRNCENLQNSKFKPYIFLQVSNIDFLGLNSEVLAELALDLNNLPEPTKRVPDLLAIFFIDTIEKWKRALNKFFKCKQLNNRSLFENERTEGWWRLDTPNNLFDEAISSKTKNKDLVCYVRMSLEILDSYSAKLKPCGRGRSEPNAHPKLEEPMRDALFDNNFFNPFHKLDSICTALKTRKRSELIKIFIIFLIFTFILVSIWSIPSALINRIVSRII